MSLTLNPAQLVEFLALTIPAGHPILVTGAPGIGKTDLMHQAADLVGADLILSHPAVEDPTVPAGMPWITAGDTEARFLPFGIMAQALKVTKRTVWFLDDLGQATPAVQAAYMQLLLARRLNGHVLPDLITFVAATNRRQDRAGVSGILEPVKSRFKAIIELETTIADWSSWAFGNNIQPMMIAFLRYRPELLSAFAPSADMTNSPSPRTWANASALEALNLPQAIEVAALSGAVGEAAAGEYLAFRQMANSLVNLDEILLNPDTAAIPTKPSELYATSVGLAGRANAKNLARIGIYMERMVKAKKAEFAVMTMRDAARREPALTRTEAFTRIHSGEIGQLMTGRE